MILTLTTYFAILDLFRRRWLACEGSHSISVLMVNSLVNSFLALDVNSRKFGFCHISIIEYCSYLIYLVRKRSIFDSRTLHEAHTLCMAQCETKEFASVRQDQKMIRKNVTATKQLKS